MKPDPLYLEAGARNVRMTTASFQPRLTRPAKFSANFWFWYAVAVLGFWGLVFVLFNTMDWWAS